ncbi:unnamed protein product [Knipowitschia caucasica]|uniref:CLOCK-interacting pacemaker a n=2 Tax=Knipowitschia caucasica TaxID=637954 RepID=A0AAV2JIM0_KNICA
MSRRHRTPSFTMATHLRAKSDMERDSGFSDASSEYMSAVEQADSEEPGRHGRVRGPDPASQQVALMGGSYAGVSPMIIMNNFLLKQPSNPVAEKQWGYSSPMEVMPQSQVVLLQPMLSNGSSSSSKSSSENDRQSRSYTPVKSYPRIAPHPGEHLSKRVGSSRIRGTAEYEPRQRRHHHSHKVYSTGPPESPLPAPGRHSNAPEPLNNQVQVIEAQVCDQALTSVPNYSAVPTYTHEFQKAISDISIWSDKDTSANHGNKLKRFSNTYNILSQSGLLEITMRTKQLIKENRHTQSQLQQLQEQTSLLLDALSSGNSQLWTKLQHSLQDTQTESRATKTPTLLL